MFLAVANFAAAPTGASLITRFLKQPKPPPPASHSSTPNKRLENGNLAVAEQEQIGNRLVPADDSVTNSFVSGQQQGLMSGQEDPDAHTTDNMQLHCSRSEEAAVALIGAEQSVCSSQLNTSRSTTLKSDENTGRAAATPQAEVLHAHHRACQLHEQGSKGPDPVQAGLSGISPKLAPSGLQQGTPDPVQLGATGNDPVPAQQSAECIGFTEANNVAIAADRQSPAGPMAQYAAQHNTQCGMQAMTDADRDSNAQPGPGQLRSTLKAGNDSGPACPSKRLRETSGNAEPQHRKQVRR